MIQRFALLAGVLLTTLGAWAQPALTISGVTDKSTYNDTASFSVPTTAGYSQVVYLNGTPVPSAVTHVVNRMDYYDLTVSRTNNSIPTEVSNRTVRFIVLSSNRGSPEKGLIEWLPYPSVPATASEFAGANMRLIAPQEYPAGLEVPIIAWIENNAGAARRANGFVRAAGFESSPIKILRGVGSGFLPPQSPGANLNFTGQLHSLSATQQISIDASTTWTTIGGVLNGDVTWPANSRIHVTNHILVTNGTLTVEAGTVVKLNSLVTITNYGRIVVNGTATQPVVFTSTNHIVPDYNVGAWGGFVMRTNGVEMVANYLIINGAGGAKTWGFAPGASHKTHQPVFHLHWGSTLNMTNSAVINTHGQLGNGYRSTMNLDRCLVQRSITCGEWDTCTNVINRSALIEFPEENGNVNPTIVDYDYDGFYIIKGTNYFKDTLIGFCKDDALDAGSDDNGDPLGSVRVEHCWIESALHESMAWSGHNRKTFVYDTVSMNSGQGIENGWTDGGSSYAGTQTSPDIYAENLLSVGNSVGARVGDNYNWAYRGMMRITNSLVLYNYRDLFLKTWNGVGVSWDTNSWVDRTNQIVLENTALSQPDPRFPLAPAWNPTADAPRLAFWMTAPPNVPVGIGAATWSNQYPMFQITNGVPVRLSSFTTNNVSVNYVFENAGGTLGSGTLTFVPGETVKRAFPSFNTANETFVRFSLSTTINGEVTGQREVFFVKPEVITPPPPTLVIASNSTWKYNDLGVDLGTAWRATNYDDSTWSSGVAELGFNDNDEATLIRSNNASGRIWTYYFRRAFTIANPTSLTNLSMWLLRDDGAVVYVNSNEVFRSANMPSGTISFNTAATATGEDSIDTATISITNLVPGQNIIAVEVHQEALTSSDLSFALQLMANPMPPLAPQTLRFGRWDGQFTLGWSDGSYLLEDAPTVTGTWNQVTSPSPVTISPTNQQQYFRLRK
jgi:hypothetical protein